MFKNLTHLLFYDFQIYIYNKEYKLQHIYTGIYDSVTFYSSCLLSAMINSLMMPE
jgi:hypothetical protein